MIMENRYYDNDSRLKGLQWMLSIIIALSAGDSISLFTGKVSYWLATRGPVATSLTFRVRACRGAQLILSSELAHNLSVAHYTIALDTRTVIRHNRRVRAHLYTPGVLSCAEDRYFWLSWKNGLVRLGSGSLHGVGEVLKWKNPNPFDVNAIGLVTNAGVKGRWRVQTNVGESIIDIMCYACNYFRGASRVTRK